MKHCSAENTSRYTCLRRLLVATISLVLFICRTGTVNDGWIISENGNQNNKEAASLFDRHWPEMKEQMCPNMSPNPNVWSALFELARMELGFSEDRIKLNEADDNAVADFFRFNTGGMGHVSHDNKHHMAYLTVWKGGNNQISSNLRSILGGNGSVWPGYSMRDLFSASRIPTSKLNLTCVVTAVRDPVEHFLSAYNEVEGRNSPEYMKKRSGKYRSWTNPLLFASYGNGTTARFEQFVSDFIVGPQRANHYVLELQHVFSMTGVLWGLKQLKDCSGDEVPRLTAYLPSLSNLDTEFPKLLQRTCSGLPHLDSFVKKFVHPSQSDPYNTYSAARQVWGHHEGASRALCAIHALDYACFESIPVPSLCQSVFANQQFRDHLLHAAATGNKTTAACS